MPTVSGCRSARTTKSMLAWPCSGQASAMMRSARKGRPLLTTRVTALAIAAKRFCQPPDIRRSGASQAHK